VIVAKALERLADDPGALFEPDVLEAIKAVRTGGPAGYARIRAQAKDGKVSVGQLDRLTTPDRADNDGGMFPVIEPWPEPVDGAALVLELCRVIQTHVIADKPTIIASALWAIHSWCMDVFTVSPLAHITAPEKRCGKTVLLTALSRLVCRPLPASNISPAALFRSMELWQPTLLIDEADTFLRDNEEARGLINSGLYRETAFVIRTVGDDHIPTQFRTWGAKVVCGIGKLADTIEDRSIPLRLRRKVAGETVANIRLSDPDIWKNLQQRIARWVEDNRYAIGQARPAPALGLNDRAQDCWEPLLAIADLAGGEWPGCARATAQTLHGIEEETPSINVELLRDIKDVFERRQTSRLATTILIGQLIADDELPWATWNRGNPIRPRQLSQRLSEFSIKPKPMRIHGSGVVKGYDLTDFHDVFARYLSIEPPVSAVTQLQPHSSTGSEGVAIGNASGYTNHVTGYTNGVTDVATASGSQQTAPPSQSTFVTDKASFPGEKEDQSEGIEREGFSQCIEHC